MTGLRQVVSETGASDPYAGMARVHMQIAAGLLRLAHDVHYFETTSSWPYDPFPQTGVNDFRAEPALARPLNRLGL